MIHYRYLFTNKLFLVATKNFVINWHPNFQLKERNTWHLRILKNRVTQTTEPVSIELF
jgi:hypothetical protein